MKSPDEMVPRLRWTVMVLCLAAAGMSLWLSVEKWTDRIDSLAGCGAGSGCANVLGSKWSVVFGSIPVSAVSFLLYMGVMISLGIRGGRGRRLRWLRVFSAWLFLWAALWFTGLQIFVLKSICPYCMTMHGLGVLLGVTILIGERGIGKTVQAGGRLMIVMMGGAACCVAGLAAIQHFGPEPATHRVDRVEMSDVAPSDEGGIHSKGAGRRVIFLDGKKTYNIDQLPHLGDANADHVMVEYFDYTCEACREMHTYLEGAVAWHPGKLAVIVLPVPLNSACNPHLPKGVKDYENACELARLSLRVWRADPSKFAEFHRNLFDLQGLPVEVAESMAVGQVGEQQWAGDHDAWIDAVLAQNVADYQVFIKHTPVMPKLLLKGSVMVQGVMKNKETMESLLEEHLGLKSR